jgi:hypothetical protein
LLLQCGNQAAFESEELLLQEGPGSSVLAEVVVVGIEHDEAASGDIYL